MRIADKGGRPVARGFYDPSGPLAIRVCTTRPSERLDDTWASSRLERAIAARSGVLDPSRTDAYRLVGGEGDGLPGLVVDRYADTLVLKLDGPIAEAFWDAQAVAEWLAERLDVRCVFQRMRTRGGAEGRPLVGVAPSAPVPFIENGHRFVADVVSGQKTGFFLDQRDNRQRVGAHVRAGDRLLNVFGYNGGFSIYAGAAGASSVTTLDIAPAAIADATRIWALNDLPEAAHHGVAEDAFAFLKRAADRGETWDVVVLDPPAFAPSRKVSGNALDAYARLAALGASVTTPGGLLVCASCSGHISALEFEQACADGIGKARRSASLLGAYGQPFDHPAPLACAELRYLKSLFLRLDG